MENLWEHAARKRKDRNSESSCSVTSPSVRSPVYKKSNFVTSPGLSIIEPQQNIEETIHCEEQGHVLSQIARSLNKLSSDKSSIRKTQDQIVSRLDTLDNRVEMCSSAVTLVNDELKVTKLDNVQLTNRVEKIENAIGDMHVDMKRKSDNARKNNIMFYGITEGDHESWEQTEDKVREILHTDAQIDNAKSPEGLQIERAQRIGVKRTGKIRPVLVRFTQLKQRYKVMDIARERIRDKGVSVGDDFSKEIRETRRKLQPMLKIARDEGKRAHLRYDKLRIDDVTYKLGDDGRLVVVQGHPKRV